MEGREIGNWQCSTDERPSTGEADNLHCTVVQTVMGLMDTVGALAIVLSALRTTAHVCRTAHPVHRVPTNTNVYTPAAGPKGKVDEEVVSTCAGLLFMHSNHSTATLFLFRGIRVFSHYDSIRYNSNYMIEESHIRHIPCWLGVNNTRIYIYSYILL